MFGHPEDALNKIELENVLKRWTDEALSHGPYPTYGKVGTIKALVDLGEGWHNYREIQRELNRHTKTGNIYSFSLARQYPDLIETDGTGKFRINPEILSVIRPIINKHATLILKALEQVRQERK